MKGLVTFFCVSLLLTALVFYFNEPFTTVKLNPVINVSPPLVIGVIPYLPSDEMILESEPIIEYLKYKTGKDINLTVAADYKTLAKLLDHSKIHLAVFSHGSYELLSKNKPWEIICRAVQKGQVYSKGSIVVRADSEIYKLSDLKGKSFAYVDRYSGTGFVFPNKILLDAGLEPLSDFASVHFTHSHEASIKGLLEGKYDGTAVYDGALSFLSDSEIAKTRILVKTKPIPTDPIVVNTSLNEELKNKIKTAMLNFHLDPEGKKYLNILNKRRGTEKYIDEAELERILEAATE